MDRRDVYSPRRSLLLDANIAAGYYLPESVSEPPIGGPLHGRIATIIESVRHGVSPDIVLYIPTICVVEIYGIFAKYRFGEYNKQVKKTIPDDRYLDVVQRFSCDLRNNTLFIVNEFSRDHVDASHLINRIDNYMPAPDSRRMGSMDHVIIATGIQLARTHGRDNFAIVSQDTRMNEILQKAGAIMGDPAAVAEMHLDTVCKDMGLPVSPVAFPRAINLRASTDLELERFFDIWPLPTSQNLAPPPKSWHRAHLPLIKALVDGVRHKIAPDRLPFTHEFERIYREIVSKTGLALTRREVLQGILNLRKGGLLGPWKGGSAGLFKGI